jgi:hypothetical protein
MKRILRSTGVYYATEADAYHEVNDLQSVLKVTHTDFRVRQAKNGLWTVMVSKWYPLVRRQHFLSLYIAPHGKKGYAVDIHVGHVRANSWVRNLAELTATLCDRVCAALDETAAELNVVSQAFRQATKRSDRIKRKRAHDQPMETGRDPDLSTPDRRGRQS